ncbi:prepilin-type N-terminal cleavage/methylation domain-containing protein [Pelagicoccus sp. SDUM812002]|uniref:PulJ/GspJ family protein n=1 Tax=Pelagicoccus sp. SDUM812002 TaxID=3041266 RepID=UPI00280EF258|nr:prepilin-type N-terminal cleavage/methylation domain-containing protein [Pelagicoccus sp. SDUM812002]MDQ8187564.1 prepilin-type N-terminal cleavage/methylation domain-containing protein [Pelagicoccus sp. SDUM812002]
MKTYRVKAAFTLIELIVSLAITAVIAFFVFSFATNLAELWRKTEGGVDTELDAQIALDRIAMDLESAIFQERKDEESNELTMFAVSAISKDDLQPQETSRWNRWLGVAKSERPDEFHFDPANHRYGWGGAWVRFFSAAPSFNAISYHIARRRVFDDSLAPARYLLHRAVVAQNETLLGGLDIVEGKYAQGEAPNRTFDVLAQPWLESVILEDVVDFGIRLYVFEKDFNGTDDSPRGLRLIFPADGFGKIDDDDDEHLASSFATGDYSERYPDVIEIFLRVLDDPGADLLVLLEEGEGLLDYEEIIDKHSRLYRRMIRMPGRESKGYTP